MLEYSIVILEFWSVELMSNKGHNVRKGKQGFQPIRKTPLEAPKATIRPINALPLTSGEKVDAYDSSVEKFLKHSRPNPASLRKEAENRKGSSLTEAESKTVEVLGEWYENGSLKTYAGLNGTEGGYNVNFTDTPVFTKGNKTIGYVQIGNEGFGYFYEVEGDEVSFRQGDGFYHNIDTKLPLNYSLRKKLNGEQISENNRKWAAESLVNRFGG